MNDLHGVAERLVVLAQKTKKQEVLAELTACASAVGRWAQWADDVCSAMGRIDEKGERLSALRGELAALVNAPEGSGMVEVLETAVEWVRIVSGALAAEVAARDGGLA